MKTKSFLKKYYAQLIAATVVVYVAGPSFNIFSNPENGRMLTTEEKPVHQDEMAKPDASIKQELHLRDDMTERHLFDERSRELPVCDGPAGGNPPLNTCYDYNCGGPTLGGVHFYTCCNYGPGACADVEYDGASSGDYCGPNGENLGDGNPGEFVKSFTCGTCANSLQCKNHCDTTAISFPGACWNWSNCFEACCTGAGFYFKKVCLGSLFGFRRLEEEQGSLRGDRQLQETCSVCSDVEYPDGMLCFDYCGDGICNGDECPSTCPEDCESPAPSTVAPSPQPVTPTVVEEDPVIKGFKGQVFKFHGRSEAWYAMLAAKSLQWNDYFYEYDKCSLNIEDRMFVTKTSVFLPHIGQKISVEVLDNEVTSSTSSVSTGCPQDKPNCLGEGTIAINIDGVMIDTPGQYPLADGGRVIAHNILGSCSNSPMNHFTELTDEELQSKAGRTLRPKGDGGRRLEKDDQQDAIDFLLGRKATDSMIDAEVCGQWIDKRIEENNLFDQPGVWSSIYVETSMINLHIEYHQIHDSDCDRRSFNTYISKISPELLNEQWEGVMGETRYVKHYSDGSTIDKNRYEVLSSDKDEDYEVQDAYGTDFVARHLD